MNDRKKLLILAPRFPYPVVGGDRLRIYFLCKILAKEFDLTLLSLCETEEEMLFEIPSDGVFKKVERIYLSRKRSYFNCMLALFTGKPLQVAYYQSNVFFHRLSSLIDSHDALFCHLIRTADYGFEIKKPLIVEFTDAISMNYERVKALAKSTGIKPFIYSFEQKRLKAYEHLVGARADLNVFVSSIDAHYLFGSVPEVSSKTIVCSNGVDLMRYPFSLKREGKDIAFIGNMYSVQNLDAVKWFIKYVMPYLLNSGFRFLVVGKISNSDASYLSSFPCVIVTGLVDSIEDAVSDAFIGVCPMRIGAGVQNKILEYMAVGLPAITSSVGYEGLAAEPNVDLIVADEPKEISQIIISLYNNKPERERLANNGRAYVQAHHSWESRLTPLIKKIKSLVN